MIASEYLPSRLLTLLTFPACLADCYDNPSALMTQLEQSTGMTDNTFALTYSVYSLPNMVLPFFGGACCDRLGVLPTGRSLPYIRGDI